MPRHLAATRPGSTATVLEVDSGVVELGRRELGVDTIPGLDVRIGDARTSLDRLPSASADVVVGDAFGSRSVPWHLATAEFADDVHPVLRPGVYVPNVIDHDANRRCSPTTGPPSTSCCRDRPSRYGPGTEPGGGRGRLGRPDVLRACALRDHAPARERALVQPAHHR
ncbi:fused MFS/spermidine synthase [Pseudonocardia sp. 73-21]|uniref:fused MFS/spermidine synthase n=1 Tax=Pseudonocardia sp. 73-21 TaxID=1895809 RepID=UPI00343634DC